MANFNNIFERYLGTVIDGGEPVGVKLYEYIHSNGNKWSLYIGNAQNAIKISKIGLVCGVGSEKVTHVINCAVKAGSAYRRIEMRDDILYAAVSTNDWPEPMIGTTKGDAEKPNWLAALSLSRSSFNELDYRNVCVYIHCVYGKNRSAITCAILLKYLFGNQDSSVSTIDDAISYMKHIKPDIDVMHPYREWGKEFTLEIPSARRKACRVIGCLHCREGHTHYCKVCKTHDVTHFSRHCLLNNIVNNTHGCSVILLKDYFFSGVYIGLTAHVIFDHTNNYCFPTESRDEGESSIRCAWRALYEELHVNEISEDMLTNPRVFKCIGDKKGKPNIYISRLRDKEIIKFTKLDFRRRREPYERMKAENRARHLWKPFLETKNMENLLIEPILDQEPNTLMYGQTPQGIMLDLRDVALRILRDDDVRKYLRIEVENSKARNNVL